MTPGSFTVSWTAVEGADSYDYQCGWQDGEILSTVGTELTFDGLEVGAEYSLFVKSMPSDTMVFSESDWAEVSVTIGNMYSDENMFSIDMVDMADVRTVVYKITPKEPEMLFFREAFEDIAWEELGAEPEAVWTAALENYKNIFGSSTLDMIAEKGVVESQFEYVYNQHTYILVAGIDEELNRITSVVDTVFYSGEVPPFRHHFHRGGPGDRNLQRRGQGHSFQQRSLLDAVDGEQRSGGLYDGGDRGICHQAELRRIYQ